MEVPQGKHAWMVKIGEKGQFVIPKEARDIFGFHPGDELLVLGDDERGIAILPKAMQREYMLRIFSEMDNGGDSKCARSSFSASRPMATPTRRSVSCASSPRAVTRSATTPTNPCARSSKPQARNSLPAARMTEDSP